MKPTRDILVFYAFSLLLCASAIGQEPAAEAPGKVPIRHAALLDSAEYYKQGDIRKSLEFVTRSIEMLGDRSNTRDLAASLVMLGDIYEYHQQYDLAVNSFREALETQHSLKAVLRLGRAYVLNGAYRESADLLEPEIDVRGMSPEQRVELCQILGDAYEGLGEVSRAVAWYREALTIADKNQMAPEVTDLNSRIAAAFDRANRMEEAEAYFGNSLRLSQSQEPARAARESEKVADFYNRRNRFPEEIAQRRQTLQQLRTISDPTDLEVDSITPQGINYKIGAAYLAQDRANEAISYLSESIEEAATRGDLDVQKNATRELSAVYRERGDFRRALDLYQDYVALVDTIYRRKEAELTRTAELNREIAGSQVRINTLEQERELSRSKYDLALAEQRLTQEVNTRQQVIIYSLLAGLLLTGIAAFLYYRSNREKERANRLLALQGLRSQMNPHFIFNALNSVNNFIARHDERSANRYLSDFSQLMRTVMEYSEKDFIPLKEELELLELYLKLEHDRFPDKFNYLVKVAPGVDPAGYRIPPMLLQPYVENAVWHGLRYKEGKGMLEVHVGRLVENAISISITDDGVGRKRSAALKTKNQQMQKSRGMGNIRKRIEILNAMYGDRIDVRIHDLNPDGTGTRVVLNLRQI